ncbi:Ni,Fe-hydrogenase III large subunit [Nakamurella panacisegetis]|uniref:Ni,Fe-hydrogenase III large subunit n=1 Tax=Nakamurella panacisegetis TaxID=1090615 RepID=A0A1H0RUD3_9ACTN|nr:NADH-quinone oxidoreductase subunit C [Nakamurella panacisegetis]SDP33057.1 Ni,Fe-hydrogenase III large subunit [Nakamurella panacisegetis]
MNAETAPEPASRNVGRPVGHHRTAFTVTSDKLPSYAQVLLGRGFRLALVAGHDDQGGLRAVYLFTDQDTDRRVELHVPMPRSHPHLASLARISFPAGRFEREMRDLFGIVPDDHPLPARLVRHFHWPKGWYPMLTDAGEPPTFGDVDGPYEFRTVEGPGVYEIPVGPVHAGLIEPGHFRFSVVGETILNLKARLWFVHRGIEKLFEGRVPAGGLELAERVSGDTSVGHTLAFCRAVEDALDLPVPVAAQQIRVVLLELERIYNHVTDLGALCNDTGYSVLNAQALRLREELLRINDAVTAHRLLRGAITPGGAAVMALPDPVQLSRIGADMASLVALALDHSVLLDRLTGTAVLTRQQATDIGVLGFAARASGLQVDARRDDPAAHIHHPRIDPAPGDGDVLSRFMIRAQEIDASIATINALVIAGPRTAPAPALPAVPGPPRSGVGIVEGWRGTIVHRIELAGDGTLSRVKIVDPSFFNWPALPVALQNTIVPDFPLANKSFNLSYAGNDL